ncbi:MAG: MMPL family transporter [Spirochaetes bacterium]|nr:MMPL family transporter [Spirochaetota bacterium]
MKFINFFLPEHNKNIIIIFIIFFIITIVLVFGNLNIRIDNDVSILLPVNEETEYEREKIRILGKEFPSNQMVFIGVKDNPFASDKIRKLWELCNELNKLKVAKTTLNPFNAVFFEKFNDSFKLSYNSMNNYPETQEEIDEFLDKIYSNRHLLGSVISYDKQTAGIVISMNYNALMGAEIKNKSLFMKLQEFLFNKNFGPQKIDRSYFCRQIENVIGKYTDTFDIFMAGVPVYEAKTKEYMQKDIFTLLIPVMFVMLIIFYLSFRSLRGTYLPILTILLSLGWTMGLISWLRFKLNIVGILLPPLIMTIGSSYTIQFINSYYINNFLYKDSRDVLIHTIKIVTPSILLAALTTMVGFGSFITARIKPIREFGGFINISIIFTLLITFFVISNILVKLIKPKVNKFESIKNDLFSKILDKLKFIIPAWKFLFISIFIIVIVLFIVFIRFIKIETNPANYFKDSGNVRKSLIYLQKNFGGTNHYNITVRSIDNRRHFFKSREGLLSAKKIHDYLTKGVIIDGYNMIGWFISPVTLVEDLNFKMNGKQELPEDEQIIKRFFNYLMMASNVPWIKSIMNNDLSAITFQVRPKTTNEKNNYLMTEQELAKLTKKLMSDLEKIANEDGRITITLWGEILLLSKISKFLISDQIWSLTISIIIVFLICLIYFRSFYLGFIALIPLTFGVVTSFTVMSLFKIPLDIATVMIAAISIGMGVDNSILFLINFKKNLGFGQSYKDAVFNTINFTSRPILFTSLALIMGFAVFLLSSFRPIVYFGMLIAISMFSCVFATLFILPSFLLVAERIKTFFIKKS